MAAESSDALKAAERLEKHLAREFVQTYVIKALGRSPAVKIEPARVFLAARFSGLKVRSQILLQVLEEFTHGATPPG
jgi:hypothetical protein